MHTAVFQILSGIRQFSFFLFLEKYDMMKKIVTH